MTRGRKTIVQSRRARRQRASAGALAAALTALFAWLLAAGLAGAFVSAPIAIDGDFRDWAGVAADSANVAHDTVMPEDPDYPGQPDRDTAWVTATYDDDYVYFAWRRTAGGTKAITFGAYVDLDGDGLLQSTDRVVVYTVSSGGPYCSQGWILHYNQARDSSGGLLYPAGDPMGGDGDTPDGWVRWQDGYTTPTGALDAYLSADGVECEARVAWADLGVAPGSAISMHFASGNGESWGVKDKASTTYKWIGGDYVEENRGQVEDNVLGTTRILRRAVTVTPDGAAGAPAGGSATFTHAIRNSGNQADTYDLTAISARGWPVVLTDAGGATVTLLSLPPGEAATVTVTASVPLGTLDGVTDVIGVTATSRSDDEVSGSARDTITVGSVAVFPDRSGTAAPGESVRYAFTVLNTSAETAELDLTATSSRGWPVEVTDDLGAQLSSLSLAPGSSAEVFVTVSAPVGASVGHQDATRLVATKRGDPQVSGSAVSITSVRSALALGPDRADAGAAGASVTYRHTVTNSLSTPQTVALAATSTQGWSTALYAADGVTPISSLALGPNGDAAEIVVRVFVPADATTGVVDTTTVTASAGPYSATANDETTVRSLATYSTAAYSLSRTDYDLGTTVYARGAGLGAYGDVYFVWKNPTDGIVRTSPDRRVDTQGMAFDELPLLDTYPEGDWTVELYGASNGALLDAAPFVAGYDAEITALSATDADTIGTDVDVDCTVENYGNGTIPNSTITYVIWWDENGNGEFDAGDLWVDSGGAPHVWDGVTPVSTHLTSPVSVPGGTSWSDPGWSVNNADFPNQGNYNLTATWTSVSGKLIDEKTTQFYSVPTIGEFLARLGVPPSAVVVVGTAIWLGLLAFLRSRRRWLSFYGLGVLGGVIVSLFVAQLLGFDQRLEAIEASTVAAVASALGLKLEVLGGSGLAIKNHVGWGVFDIGIECSALIEMAALAGLVGFYPAFSAKRKGTSVAVGVAATFAFNIVRILLIVGIIAWLGTAWVFPAHAVIGRIFFFTAIILLFWWLMTRPTIHLVRAKVEARVAAGEACDG